MTATPSAAWTRLFPGPRIPGVLAYIDDTWRWLCRTYQTTLVFHHEETFLTDNLSEALGDQNRRIASKMDCDFIAEIWNWRRDADGVVTRIARTDIRVLLGEPALPQLVIEFKKLDGSTDARRRYCFDGMNRFVEGKYGVGQVFGVMYGFSPNNLITEARDLAAYIGQPAHAARLCCVLNSGGEFVTTPSPVAPGQAYFESTHNRPTLTPNEPIVILHALLSCPHATHAPPTPPTRRPRGGRSKPKPPASRTSKRNG